MKRKHKGGSNAGLIIGLSLGGVLLFTVLGVALFLAFGKKGERANGDGNADGDAGGLLGGASSSDSPKLTRENYDRIEDGHMAKEIEAILGNPGRVPTASDFDHVFGKYPEELSRMPMAQARKVWEENNARGVVRAWKNGPLLMMVVYVNPPDKPDTRIVASLLRCEDGGVLMMSGTGIRPEERPNPANYGKPEPKPKPPPTNEVVAKPQPKQPKPPPTVPKSSPNDPPLEVTAEDLLKEFAADRNAATSKYRGRKVKVTGKIASKQLSVVIFEHDGAKVQSRIDAMAKVEISKYKVGDTITVTGMYQTYIPSTRLLLLEGCSLEK